MVERLEFTAEELKKTLDIYKKIKVVIGSSLIDGDEEKVRKHLINSIECNQVGRDAFGLNPILFSFQAAQIVVDEIGLKRDAVLAVLLHPSVSGGFISIEEVNLEFGEAVSRILHGLQRISDLYSKNPVIESENFRNLLLSFAEDMQVILIMIASRVNLMRQIRDCQNMESKSRVSEEAAYLYAPLAINLGCIS